MVAAILLSIVFIASSPVIIVSNLLIVATWFRFKRLRTPSNAFVVSLAVADLSFGICLPMAVIYQLMTNGEDSESSSTPSSPSPDYSSSPSSLSSPSYSAYSSYSSSSISPPGSLIIPFNIRPFSILIVFAAASLLSIAAIALDRFTSVAQPLRYNHFVTTSYVHKFIGGLWLYAIVMGTIGFLSHPAPPAPWVITWLALFVYLPSALCCVLSYWYIYMVARSHARAIHSVEVSLSRGGGGVSLHCGNNEDESPPGSTTIIHSASSHHSYGLTLALILGMLFFCWAPILISALLDNFMGTDVLGNPGGRAGVAVPIIFNALLNPWLYGFRSSEFRLAVSKILDTMLTRLTGRPPTFVTLRSNKQDATSCASNVRLLAVSPTATTVQCYGDRNHLQILLCDQTQL